MGNTAAWYYTYSYDILFSVMYESLDTTTFTDWEKNTQRRCKHPSPESSIRKSSWCPHCFVFSWLFLNTRKPTFAKNVQHAQWLRRLTKRSVLGHPRHYTERLRRDPEKPSALERLAFTDKIRGTFSLDICQRSLMQKLRIKWLHTTY